MRAKMCQDVTVYGYVQINPTLEMCSGLRLSAFNTFYPLADEHFEVVLLHFLSFFLSRFTWLDFQQSMSMSLLKQKAKLHRGDNRLFQVFDFSKGNPACPEPHWRALVSEEAEVQQDSNCLLPMFCFEKFDIN